MSATLRYRGDKNNLIELAKNLDAFKKVPEKYTETGTEIGGTLSLLSRLLIVWLIYKELRYYQEANLVYNFQPDIAMDDKVQMHVDITVAMPCASLSGVDLMDETQQDVFAYGTLQREAVWWSMPIEQRQHFERQQHMNSFLREEYHSVADILFRDIIKSNEVHESGGEGGGGAGVDRPGVVVAADSRLGDLSLGETQYDACRLHGTLGINKVAGVLHLVGGAQPVVGLFEDHFMIEFRRVPANFTHRINRLSFGQYSRRIVQPLEGDETLIPDEATTVQYILKIVPTEIHNTFSTINTYQYAVTENVRKLDPEVNSYGSPGIYFKYDWSALKIVVRTDRDNLIQFTIRLCSIIAGIIVISGILNSVLVSLQRRLLDVFAPQAAKRYQALKRESEAERETVSAGSMPPLPAAAATIVPNELISTANKMFSLTATTTATLSPNIPNATLLPQSQQQQYK